MDKIWRLLVAIFFLVITLILIVVSYIFLGNSAFAGIGIYGAFILFLIGLVKGIFVIIDHHRDNKEE